MAAAISVVVVVACFAWKFSPLCRPCHGLPKISIVLLPPLFVHFSILPACVRAAINYAYNFLVMSLMKSRMYINEE